MSCDPTDGKGEGEPDRRPIVEVERERRPIGGLCPCHVAERLAQPDRPLEVGPEAGQHHRAAPLLTPAVECPEHRVDAVHHLAAEDQAASGQSIDMQRVVIAGKGGECDLVRLVEAAFCH